MNVWVEVYNKNVLAAIRFTTQTIPLMRKQKWGRVVTISSLAATRTISSQSVYSATKAGLVSFGDGLRDELTGSGVRVVSLLPGSTDSLILRHMPEGYLEEHGVLNEPRMKTEEVAQVVAWLLDQPPSVMIEEVRLTPHGERDGG